MSQDKQMDRFQLILILFLLQFNTEVNKLHILTNVLQKYCRGHFLYASFIQCFSKFIDIFKIFYMLNFFSQRNLQREQYIITNSFLRCIYPYCVSCQICYIMLAIVICVRVDAYSVVYSICLGILLLLSRHRNALIWPVFSILLTVMLPVQYLLCLGFPPGACIGIQLLYFM